MPKINLNFFAIRSEQSQATNFMISKDKSENGWLYLVLSYLIWKYNWILKYTFSTKKLNSIDPI